MPSIDRLKHSREKRYWQGLAELSDDVQSEAAQSPRHHHHSGHADVNDSAISRREFLQLMGASIAFAGATGCRRPVEHIVPYVKQPEEVVPGIPLYYATTMPLGEEVLGLVVESHEGRPTKIEGNEQHPASRGRAGAIHQASVLELYDPDRPRAIVRDASPSTWANFLDFWREQYPAAKANGGADIAVLTEPFSSPSRYRLYELFMNTFPRARWAVYEPVSNENIYAGIEVAAGKIQRPLHHFDRARVILSLDSDFLLTESNSVANSYLFSKSRDAANKTSMNRLYCVESQYTTTGAMADHRLRLRSSQIAAVTIALASELRSLGMELRRLTKLQQPALDSVDKKWIQAVAKDLYQARGAGIVVAGRRQPPIVHALVYAMNAALGNHGETIDYAEPAEALLPKRADLAQLTSAIDSGAVRTLFMFGGNPVYDAPADLKFREVLKKTSLSVHISPVANETSKLAGWHIPDTHYLESWGDARYVDGTLSIIQPLIAPLYDGRSNIEVLHAIVTGEEKSGYEIVRETWKGKIGNLDFENKWRRALHDGVLQQDGALNPPPPVQWARLDSSLAKNPPSANTTDTELIFQPSPALYDGRFANNGWLQELPDPMTKLMWDNVLMMSPTTARELGVNTAAFFNLDTTKYQMVEINIKGKVLSMPAYIVPGHADRSVSVYLGYGREHCGRIGNGVGFNVNPLRTMDQPDIAVGATIKVLQTTYPLSRTQDHNRMEGRPLIREAAVTEFNKNGKLHPPLTKAPPLQSLWKEHTYEERPQWGMAIDLNTCTGCNACVIACQSENNIPIVGKKDAGYGREMHWIRIDRYFAGDENDPEAAFQPVPCMHCENAPCEQVCPVQATNHDREGINVMVYNRCIGTRYCSNNCPYKVRRFNFFNYTRETPEVMKLANNPDVTVRFRGVMEKCTYCIQRINRAKIDAKVKGVELKDGDVVTACQQTCPAGAIVFGDILDEKSMVYRKKRDKRDYVLLEEWNTRPRTSYLGRLRNPNPELG